MTENGRPERVFLKVDGKLLPKPGNKRDPNRRYSAVSSPEYPDGIIVEFTEEEERQRDEEEAAWEAARPRREAERKLQLEHQERFRQTVKYENRIVAFVDVLGWKDFIARSVEDEDSVRRVGSMLVGLQQHRDTIKAMIQKVGSEAPESSDVFTSTAQFSDSFVFSCQPQRSHSLLTDLKFITTSMLRLGLPVRGGVCHGPIYHRDNVAFGPALVEAYNLEQQATYPRIIASVELGNALFPGPRIVDQQGKFLGFDPVWRRDYDGCVFLDFLQPLIAANRWQGLPPRMFHSHFAQFREVVSKLFAQYRSHSRVANKYYWLATYFNAVLAEYPDADVEPVSLE